MTLRHLLLALLAVPVALLNAQGTKAFPFLLSNQQLTVELDEPTALFRQAFLSALAEAKEPVSNWFDKSGQKLKRGGYEDLADPKATSFRFHPTEDRFSLTWVAKPAFTPLAGRTNRIFLPADAATWTAAVADLWIFEKKLTNLSPFVSNRLRNVFGAASFSLLFPASNFSIASKALFTARLDTRWKDAFGAPIVPSGKPLWAGAGSPPSTNWVREFRISNASEDLSEAKPRMVSIIEAELNNRGLLDPTNGLLTVSIEASSRELLEMPDMPGFRYWILDARTAVSQIGHTNWSYKMFLPAQSGPVLTNEVKQAERSESSLRRKTPGVLASLLGVVIGDLVHRRQIFGVWVF